MSYVVRRIQRMATIDKHMCIQSFDFSIGSAADLGAKHLKLINN